MNFLAYDRATSRNTNILYRSITKQNQAQMEINDEILNNRQGKQLDSNEYVSSN